MSDTAERCHQGKDFPLVIPLRGVTGLRALRASCRTLEVIYRFLGAERLGMGDTAERCHQGKSATPGHRTEFQIAGSCYRHYLLGESSVIKSVSGHLIEGG